MKVLFVESMVFTRRWSSYLSDDELREFQHYLLHAPDAGKIVRDTGGIRKIRWKVKGSGKRGGLRILYFWQPSKRHIYLLTVYLKNELEDLSPEEYGILRKVVERW